MNTATSAAHEDVEIAFKRFILHETRAIASEPQADLCRVNLLGQMLNRYDKLHAAGLDEAAASARVRREFADIAQRMREMGFDMGAGESHAAYRAARGPSIGEAEMSKYLKENDQYTHKRALGVAMCASCVMPIIIGNALDMLFRLANDPLAMFGVAGMFAMIAIGVYLIVTAEKPELDAVIKKRAFTLSARVRAMLKSMRESVARKSRKRKGRGIAMLVSCVLPIIAGAAVDSLFALETMGNPVAALGVAGMFVMIGAGVYEVMMASAEKETMKRLLDREKE